MYVLVQALILFKLPQRELLPVALKEFYLFIYLVALKSPEPTFVSPGGGGVSCGGAGFELWRDKDSQEDDVQ